MQKGDFVRVAFSGKLKETGQPLDSSESAPLVLGERWVIVGIDDALLSMNVGEKKTIELEPDKAFGPRDASMIRLVPEAEFKKHGTKPYPGMMINADNLHGRVLTVSSGRVKVDFNHPLSGKTVIYDLSVNEKIEKPEDKVKALLEYYTRVHVKDLKVTIHNKDVEVIVPPIINSVMKKKVADDIMKYLGMENVKFSEVYLRRHEEEKKE